VTTQAAEGFTALFRSSPFLERTGPFYSKGKGRSLSIGLRVLEQALAAAGCLPKRAFKEPAEFAEYLKKEKTLIFDGTEQRTQRPNDNAAQKENYSGKKSVTR